MSGHNSFIFDNYDSEQAELYINGHKTFDSPERNYTFQQIKGKDGDFAMDEGTFKNVELTYEKCFFRPGDQSMQNGFDRPFSALKNTLLSKSGYKRLEDTYHPDEFRLAVFRKAIQPLMDEGNEFGVFDLIFECKPQRFLKSGEDTITITDYGAHSFGMPITNPTLFASKPIIRVYGTGYVYIGNYSFNVLEADGYTDIDCEIMDCYKGAENRNPYVQFANHEFPKLVPGSNLIRKLSLSNITKLEIIPRWFTI